MIQVSEFWRSSHPGGAVGLLRMDIDRSLTLAAEIDQKRVALENQLREQYQGVARAKVRQQPVMNDYTQYYKQFKKSYHVLLQLDSICNKNRSIPHADALIQAMFMAEMKSFILTAGHDMDQTAGSIKLDASHGDEIYKILRGDQVTCKAGDMLMADSQAVICSVIYGQDQRTRITTDTANVLYVMYVPPGIDPAKIENHIIDLEENILLAFPQSQSKLRQIILADTPEPVEI
jgi:DNA/RNA-binding domain of Phe-tRNA-synthetase-like protein